MALCFGANPYERLDWIPPDGRGMNPQLQNPGMAIHPPMLYLGLVATSVPFAFAIGALITRKLDTEWLGAVSAMGVVVMVLPHDWNCAGHVVGVRRTRMGGLLGMGWRRKFTFLPWLTGTAFFHSIMIQEKRGMLRKWNVTLVDHRRSSFRFWVRSSRAAVSLKVFTHSNRQAVGNWFPRLPDSGDPVVLRISLRRVLTICRRTSNSKVW